MTRVRAFWHRCLAPCEIDRVERARQQVNEAHENVVTWTKLYEIRRDHYERLSGTTVIPRKVS